MPLAGRNTSMTRRAAGRNEHGLVRLVSAGRSGAPGGAPGGRPLTGCESRPMPGAAHCWPPEPAAIGRFRAMEKGFVPFNPFNPAPRS